MRVLVMLAVMALPQAVGLSTVCSAGGRTGCASNPDGSCAYKGPCGTYSRGTACTTVDNPGWVASAKRTPREGNTQFLCECR